MICSVNCRPSSGSYSQTMACEGGGFFLSLRYLFYNDTPEQRDLQQSPPPFHLRDLSNHTIDAMISTSSNPSTASDVRSWPISNNSGRCSEHNSGPHSKDKITPRKSSRNAKRQNMVININGYKKWVRKCRKQLIYRHNLRILYHGREDNPLHTDAFHELIENLKEKNSNME
jgi:hypothetical protein